MEPSKEAELSAGIRFLKNKVMEHEDEIEGLKRQLSGNSYYLIISVSVILWKSSIRSSANGLTSR